MLSRFGPALLAGALLCLGGCRALPPPVWHSTATVASANDRPSEAEEPRHRETAGEPQLDHAHTPAPLRSLRPQTEERSLILVGAEDEPADTRRFFSSGFDDLEDEPPESPETEDDEEWLDNAPCLSFREDACGLFPMLRDDAVSLFTWRNALVLGAAGGVALALRDNVDGEVRAYTAQHPLRWGEGSEVLRQFGEYAWQVPALAGVYGLSLWTQDEQCHEFSKSVISAYTLTSVTTVLIKVATDTQRPSNQFEDGRYGFPSFHAASTFTIAAVLDEYYGWPAGAPAYALAALVGWSRIDQREHDLSDVVFGSVLGFVIGKTVSAAHFDRDSDLHVAPYYDPLTRSVGAWFDWRF